MNELYVGCPNQIVFTTIFEPKLLYSYQKNLEQFGHLDDTCVWVIGDRKTPQKTASICSDVKRLGLKTIFIAHNEQDEIGKRFKLFYDRLPWNNETRRNLGFLCALEAGCERLIAIDDDNWPTDDDFIGGHSLTGKAWTKELVSEPSGFHNVCESLAFEPSRAIFPRGYPFKLRETRNHQSMVAAHPRATIGVTAGLWLQEPDIDATTWLNGRVSAIRYTGPGVMALDQSTWTPINTQNTSVTRELIAAFLCIPMGWDVPGGKIQRYGDIWGGYFLQAILAGTPYHVAFGRPLVNHWRNPHDYVDDLRQEFWGTILTDWLLTLLRDCFKPTSASIMERVLELTYFIEAEAIPKAPAWSPNEMKLFLSYTAQNLLTWGTVCKQFM